MSLPALSQLSSIAKKAYTFEELFAAISTGTKGERSEAARALSAVCAYSMYLQYCLLGSSAKEETCVVNHLLRLLSELGDSAEDETAAEDILSALYALTDLKNGDQPRLTHWNETAKHLRGQMSLSPYSRALSEQKGDKRTLYSRELEHRAKTIVKPDKYPKVRTIRVDWTKQLLRNFGERNVREKTETRRVLKVRDRKCDGCGKLSTNFCSCGTVMYCSKECQRKKWPQHKQICKDPGVSRQYLPTVVDIYQDRPKALEKMNMYDFIMKYDILPELI